MGLAEQVAVAVAKERCRTRPISGGDVPAEAADEHHGRAGCLVAGEVRSRRDLVGYREGSFGILTSGGVMANFIAMALVSDVHVPRLRSLDAPPRGRALEGLRVYASDQTHFSIGRALD